MFRSVMSCLAEKAGANPGLIKPQSSALKTLKSATKPFTEGLKNTSKNTNPKAMNGLTCYIPEPDSPEYSEWENGFLDTVRRIEKARQTNLSRLPTSKPAGTKPLPSLSAKS